MKTIFLSFSIADSSVSDYFIELSNRLSKEFEVIIITDHQDKDVLHISPEIKIFKWPSRRPTKWKDFIFLKEKVRQFKPEMMISIFGAVNLFLLTGFLLRIKHRIAWIRTISSQFPGSKSLHLRKKYVYKLATKIFANSKATKLDLVEKFGVQDTKVEVIYNAVKKPVVGTTKVNRQKIIYVGRMHASKGVRTLIEAMHLVLIEFPDIKLSIIGGDLEGKEIENLRNRAEELEISESIFFTGNHSKQRVLEEFSEAYLTVVPSIVEAFGFVVIESFSVKTPVIGSKTSGIAEIIRDGKDGFLFEPENSQDLASKIIKMLKDARLRDVMSESCHKHFLEEFEVEKSTRKLAAKISDLVN